MVCVCVCVCVVNATPKRLYPHETEPVAIVYEFVWAPETVWNGAQYFALAGIRSPDRRAHS